MTTPSPAAASAGIESEPAPVQPQVATYVPPNAATVAVVCLFAIVYMALLFRRAVSGRFDLYHVLMLGTVAVIPAVFVLFPRTVHWLSQLVGVAFPFVLLFGALLAAMFIYMHRVTTELNRVSQRSRILAQEIALLRDELNRASR